MTPVPDQVPDRSLLEGCRGGHDAAWREVLDRYERLVWSIPLQHGLSRADAADVTQAVFAALLRSLDVITADAALASWLTTVAQRETWHHLRRARREAAVAEQPEAVDHSAADERVERMQWLVQGLAELRPRCRELLTELYLSGHEPSYAELSARLGIPIGSIGPTRARCLEHLQKVLRRLAAEGVTPDRDG
jgi:RNA polymerase sigma factor (sigma-70 family)